jgi:hypothetical protein
MTQKLKKFTIEKKIWGSKTTIYPSLVLHIGRPSLGRSLQLSKENIQHCKNSFFVGHSKSGSGYLSTDLIEIWIQSGSETLLSDPSLFVN